MASSAKIARKGRLKVDEAKLVKAINQLMAKTPSDVVAIAERDAEVKEKRAELAKVRRKIRPRKKD